MIIAFTRPEYLSLLLAIPVIILVHIISLKFVKKKAIKFANFEAISRIKGVELFSKNLTVLYLNIIIIILVVLSVSGMSITRNVSASRASFVLAIDSSGSMGAQDVYPNRIEAAKSAAIDFLNMVPEKTRISVVSFSGNSFIEQELTEDKDKLRTVINNINLKSVGGTDILGAVITSSNLLRDEESKIIVLISDGQANLNTLQSIIDYSNKNNVRIHSLGIGTLSGGTDETGAVFKISEDTLKTIAENTEGKYYNIKSAEDFFNSLNEIAGMTEKRDVYDMSLYLMISALALFILNFILINTRYRTLP